MKNPADYTEGTSVYDVYDRQWFVIHRHVKRRGVTELRSLLDYRVRTLNSLNNRRFCNEADLREALEKLPTAAAERP